MPGTVCISCCDPRLFSRNTNEDVYAYYDSVVADPSLSQLLGIKCNPDGLLADDHIRTFYKPVDHTLRDWMHTVVGGGVANVECGRLLDVLLKRKISLVVIVSFMMEFVLPKAHGTVDPNWLSKKRLGKKRKALQSFSSNLLALVPILAMFLFKVCGEDESHPLYDHMRCFWNLFKLIGILQLGPHRAMTYVDQLRDLIREHADLFTKLYPGHVKPKFHHLFHVVDNMKFLHVLLSCFVTERKHRATKRSALFIFRSIERGVIRDMLSRQCEAISSESESIFSERYLVHPKRYCMAGAILYRAGAAVLPCGAIHAGDFTWLADGQVVLVIAFWRAEDSTDITAQVEPYDRLADGVRGSMWVKGMGGVRFLDTTLFVSALTYARLSHDRVMVIPPAISFL